VFDGFELYSESVRPIQHAVVMLGTQQRYGFRRLVERLIDLLPQDVDVLWQTGSTDTSRLDIETVPYLPYPALKEAIAKADVVISHAGIGSTLDALSLGKCPVIVPREAAHGEHVDDHQSLIGEAIDSRHLAVVSSVDDLAFRHLEQAASARVVSSPPARLSLRGTLGGH
jgi:UDP-N-acetylglucosamine transferase subunit ALG13